MATRGRLGVGLWYSMLLLWFLAGCFCLLQSFYSTLLPRVERGQSHWSAMPEGCYGHPLENWHYSRCFLSDFHVVISADLMTSTGKWADVGQWSLHLKADKELCKLLCLQSATAGQGAGVILPCDVMFPSIPSMAGAGVRVTKEALDPPLIIHFSFPNSPPHISLGCESPWVWVWCAHQTGE